MKIEIKETKANGIVQITTLDERWYRRESDGLILPSVTWISGYYPKGVEFYKWLASKGWDEAEAIKVSAGDRGSKVHQAIDMLLHGHEVTMDLCLMNNTKKDYEELTVEEWECVMSFSDWWNETKPEILSNEMVLWNEETGYAGTMDLKCRIGEDVYIVDFKTSQNVWMEHELQLSAYRHSPENADVTKTAVLQVGYRRNKRLWKFTETDDRWNLFLGARNVWAVENPNVKPKQKDYPQSIKLTIKGNENGVG